MPLLVHRPLKGRIRKNLMPGVAALSRRGVRFAVSFPAASYQEVGGAAGLPKRYCQKPLLSLVYAALARVCGAVARGGVARARVHLCIASADPELGLIPRPRGDRDDPGSGGERVKGT